MDTVNVTQLVADLKELPRLAHGDHETWRDWCATRGFGRGANGHFLPFEFSVVATGLCTLRAYLRGRLHRMNPPQDVRDHNRAMREQGRFAELVRWNRIEWNSTTAHKFAAYYPFVAEVTEAAIAAAI